MRYSGEEGIGPLSFTWGDDKWGVWCREQRILNPLLAFLVVIAIVAAAIAIRVLMLVLSPVHFYLLKIRGRGLWQTEKRKRLELVHRPRSTRGKN